MRAERVSFSEIFEFKSKTSRRAGDGYPDGEYPFFTSSETQTKFLNEYDYRGPNVIMGTGGSANIHYCEGLFTTSADCFVASVKTKRTDVAKFYYYFLKSNLHVLGAGFRGAGLKHISKGYVDAIFLPHFPPDYQKHVVSILDKADAIRQKRQESIRLTEEFLRSVFLDMFGDPVTNPKGWDKVYLSEIAERSTNAIKAGPFGSSLKKECYVKNGYKVYGQEQVIRDDFDYGDYYIDEYKYTELESCRIKAGDILISLVGTFGKISIVPDSFKLGIINPRLMKISLDFKRALPTFVKSALSSQSMVAHIETLAHGGTMGIVNVGIMKNLKLPLPPIGLQRNFQKILSKYSEYVARQKTTAFETNSLFSSITQRAFKGEL